MFMVVGSAHLDILAYAKFRDDVIDRIGNVSIEIGGTSANIAINLVQAGMKVRFLSAMNYSSYSKLIVEYLENMGIEMWIDYRKDLPTAGFSAHVDTNGEMVSAISSTPVELVNFDSKLISQVMEDVVAVILDCNLSELAINRLVTMANEQHVPVFIAAVSEEKSIKISKITGNISGIFINDREYSFFCREAYYRYIQPSEMARNMKAAIVVTKNSDGSIVSLPSGEMELIPAANIAEKGSRMGMGDAMAAGTIMFHVNDQISFIEAASKAVEMASRVGTYTNCNQGENGAFEHVIDKINQSAEFDAMTGALNRRTTEKKLLKELDRRSDNPSKALSVLLLDIDHFKRVNDQFGHNVGDGVIIDVSNSAKSCLRDTDFLGRWGGEEFVVVLPGATAEQAAMVAERIRATVEKKVVNPYQITVSIGISTAAEGNENMTNLVESADHHLYEAKQSGRNRICGPGRADVQ